MKAPVTLMADYESPLSERGFVGESPVISLSEFLEIKLTVP